MRWPPYFYSLKFWDGVSWIVAGVFMLLVFFGVLPDTYLYSAAVILSAIKGILKFLGVNAELRLK